VDPPTSTGQEKLFLGCISIRQNAVHKICNLSRRRYVGSFPTLSYWLSTIPVVPLVTHLVEQLCCLALPEVFAKVTVSGSAEQEDVGGDRLSVAALHQLIPLVQEGGFSDWIREFASRGTIARTAIMAALRQLQQVQPSPSVASFAATSIVGQPADQAAASLAKRGVVVRRAPFEPKADLHTIASAVDILRDPQPGRQVTLYEEEGRVRYYTVSPTDPTLRVRTEVDSLRSTVQSQSDEVANLRQHLAETTGQLGDRDAQLARISQELSEMRQAHADLQASVPQQLADIQRDIAQLRAEPAAPAATRQPRKRSSGRTEPPPTS
jgi:hypothetical protein